MQYTPEVITKLKKNEVFVFGSNESGIHGAGAANTQEEKDMTAMHKQAIRAMFRDNPVAFSGDDYGCLVGQRCDFYIYISQNGRSYYSRWVKGREAADLWDQCLSAPDSEYLFDLLAEIFQKYQK